MIGQAVAGAAVGRFISGGMRRQNKALSDFIRSGRFMEARQMFDRMPQRNVRTWNAMIAGHARRGELGEARKLFELMPDRDVVSWNSILAGYALSKDPAEVIDAQKLFDEMPMKDIVSWNTLISMYVRNGRMEEATALFDEMPERNVSSWNTMISGFLQIGNDCKAIELFEKLPEIDKLSSVSALVSGLIRNKRLDDAENFLVNCGRTNKVEGLVNAYNTLIAGYGKRGKAAEARRIFDLIDSGDRNLVSWNSMIMAYVKTCDLKSARLLFDEMPERDTYSWNTMINGYVQVSEVDEALYLFLDSPDPDGTSWNTILHGFAQKGDMVQAQKYFDQMPQKVLISWNTMIAGYERHGDFEQAIQLFIQMQAMGERPDRHTLSSVSSASAGLASLPQGIQIHQMIIKTVVPDIPINNSLVTMYARCGHLADAKIVFDEMRQERDVVSWNAMIGGYAHHGLAREALQLFAEMKRMHVMPTYITFISVLHACGHAGLVEDGKNYFESMVQDFGILPQVEHYASLVDLIGRHGHLEDAMNVIDKMTVQPDRAVWGALLGACRIHNNPELAKVAARELEKIQPESSAPYVLLYNMHADDGRWEDAVEVRELMDKNRIVKLPGYSWIELHNRVHIFVSGDSSHPLSNEIYSILEICHTTISDVHLY